MEKTMETNVMGFGFRRNGKMEATKTGYLGTTIRIHSFIPS